MHNVGSNWALLDLKSSSKLALNMQLSRKKNVGIRSLTFSGVKFERSLNPT